MTLKTYVAQHGRQFGTLVGLLVLCAVMWILTPHFLTISNLLNIAEQTAIIAIIAAGMTFVILTAGIDLSVGSVLAFSGVVMASLLQKGAPVGVALAVGVLAGFGCGTINGLLISVGRLPPFIATLGMMSVARGGSLLFTEGRPISGFSESFRYLATGRVVGVPMPVLVMLTVFFTAWFVLTKTKLGRYTYAIGGNEEATILSGINVRLYKTLIYGICGGLAGLAAILLTARLNSAQPIAGMMYELDAIAATVIGGTSLMGGEGNVFGTLVGALIIGVLRNGLTLLNISSFAQQIIIGLVIIVAVLLDMTLKKGRR
ncbi:MAG: ribose ABC transporter permease [Acidobacteria bacterium]|nr:ribose ABC transporter permease [Acidobacteriota bacterium]MCW5968407.1 ribose ABC transporter permease [Blastocatellales bacterium]